MPDTLSDFAAREPPPAQSGRFRLARLTVTTNVALAGLLSVLSFARVVEVTGISAYLGTFFLIGALVPSNLLRFERYASGRRTRALAKLRKPLGVSAGVWFVAHSVVSVWELFALSLPLLPQFTRTGIVLGLLATAVFVAMLATSTGRAQRALGRNWKRLHRLGWLAVPLAAAPAPYRPSAAGARRELEASAPPGLVRRPAGARAHRLSERVGFAEHSIVFRD